MKYMVEVSAGTEKMDNFFSLAEAFCFGAEQLYALTCDGLSANKQNRSGGLTDDFYNNNLIPTVYLYRHAIELILKALCEEIGLNGDYKTHDLGVLWERCVKESKANYRISNSAKIKMKEFFELLNTKYDGVLDDQLYRYPWNSKEIHLKDQSPIVTECIETLICLYGLVHDMVLEIKHIKKTETYK